VTRARTWSRGPSLEWAHRLGASPLKRMAASWSGPDAGPTEYKVAARYYAQNGRLPSVRTAATATEIRSRQNRPAATNQLDIEIPIQVRAYLLHLENRTQPLSHQHGLSVRPESSFTFMPQALSNCCWETAAPVKSAPLMWAPLRSAGSEIAQRGPAAAIYLASPGSTPPLR
jgi:hypothetical protein